MHVPKKYFHDRIVLLLISVTVFLAFLQLVLVLLGITSGGKLNLVQYRPNLGLSGYTYDTSPIPYINFILFGFIVTVLNIIISIKIYSTKRYYAITVLCMGLLLVILSLIVSNALLIRQ
ncbi:hypothetical protein KDA00_00500 [Candidatus Saccharibacteria bacterium]|nr:hypothetical protein [Candidatus Saccharibacteria bacterium]